ncbi:hypothetical protein [Portibacter marinus]|uniref:hypothetical protein n=1 Tax=Portibacter marinus TaxID=2898660 RepID=UPI001F3A7489|nr:hypothetical protein [Portibacter marinus]
MKVLSAILIFLLIYGCNTTKVLEATNELEDETTICNHRALLVDLTNNENCGFLFQLDDGTKLLPSEMPSVDIPFIDGSYVYIGYKKYDEVKTRTNSLCGQEDVVVEITCIREYEDEKAETSLTYEDCESVRNIAKTPWMKNLNAKLKPQKIYEYDYDVGYLYLFNVNGVNYLYDCLGNQMCTTEDGGDCLSLIETLGEGKVLQVRR